MSYTIEAGTDWIGDAEDLVDLALSLAPRHAPTVVWRSFGGGVVIWGPAGPPTVLPPHQAAIWPYLDGSVTGEQLATDLASASGLPDREARREVATLVVRAASVSWVTGADVVGDWFEGRDERPTRPDVNRSWIREVDGVRWCYMEVSQSAGESAEVLEGRVSVAELWPPDSCGGRAMHLDRPAERVTLTVPGGPLAVRTADPSLVDWLAGLPGHTGDVHAPVQVFVAASSPEPGRRTPTRYRLFNGLGHLIASPVGLRAAQEAIASIVLDVEVNASGSPPSGWLAVGRSVTDGVDAVFATPASLEGGSHLLTHLTRVGAAMDPCPTVVVEPDGRHLQVPNGSAAVDWLQAGTRDDAWATELWRRRRIGHVFLPVGTASRPPAERAAAVLHDTAARDGFAQRNGLLDAVDHLLAAVPVAERVNPEQSPLATARQLARLLA